MNPEAYVREITEIKEEVKRLRAHIINLNDQKKKAEAYLREWMIKNDEEKFVWSRPVDGKEEKVTITLKSITPRAPSLTKPKNKKKKDAIALFKEQGILNPEEFWDSLQSIQKFEDLEEKEEYLAEKESDKTKKKASKKGKRSSGKKKKGGYSTSETIFLDL